MLNELAKEIHANAVAHGWWEDERSFPEIIALCHSELSEALEEYRDSDIANKMHYYCCTCTHFLEQCPRPTEECDNDEYNGCKYQKPEGIAIELADCIIRILDYCGRKGIDIDEAIQVKHEYNKGRPYRHGGKKA